jgi:hypothetical protein
MSINRTSGPGTPQTVPNPWGPISENLALADPYWRKQYPSVSGLPLLLLLAQLSEPSSSGALKDQYVMPRSLYVDVPTIAKTASRLVFLTCLFALLIWTITGFVMIHPIIAAMAIIGSIGFYLMGAMTEKRMS